MRRIFLWSFKDEISLLRTSPAKLTSKGIEISLFDIPFTNQIWIEKDCLVELRTTSIQEQITIPESKVLIIEKKKGPSKNIIFNDHTSVVNTFIKHVYSLWIPFKANAIATSWKSRISESICCYPRDWP